MIIVVLGKLLKQQEELGLERYWLWVLGNICRYWIVLILGDIFFHCDTQYDTDQTAVSTIHMMTVRCGRGQQRTAGRVGRGRVQAIQWTARVIDGIKGVGLQSNTLLCYTVVSALVSLEASTIGYWVHILVSF